MINLCRVKTLVFDCDGVVLNSNQVKTSAFYQVALSYGEVAAQALVDYHTANGGISRYEKFAYFLKEIVPRVSSTIKGLSLEEMLSEYARQVRKGLLTCEVAPGLQRLREKTAHANWLIVSGGDQAELREVFAERGLLEMFNGGIFGSPDTKEEILSRELALDNIKEPALFIGDSKYDYKAASIAGLGFVFIHGWTEVTGWADWVKYNNIETVSGIEKLMCGGSIF